MSNPLITVGISGGTDRTGVVRIEVPVYVDSLLEAITLNVSAIAKSLGINLPCVGIPFEQQEDGGTYLVKCQFEGIATESSALMDTSLPAAK